MQRLTAILLLILSWIGPVLAQDSWDESPNHYTRAQDRTAIDSDLKLTAEETARQVVVIGGNAIIDGKVEGSLVVIGGNATINGKVRREVVIVGGKASFGSSAEVTGETVLVGGPFEINPQAVFHRDVQQVNLGTVTSGVQSFKNWVFAGLILGRPLPPQLTWAWIAATIFLGLYCFFAIAFPRPIAAGVTAIESSPMTALLTGLLTLILLPPLCFVLAVSVAGILAIPFLLCGVFFLVLFGKAAVFGTVGRGLASAVGQKSLAIPVAVLLGGALLMLTYLVPFLGLIIWAASTVLGLGSVILAAAQSLKAERAAVKPVTVYTSAASTPAVAGMTSTPPIAGAADATLLERAGFWRRFAAGLIDIIIVALAFHFFKGFFVVLLLVYFVAMWAWRGTTLGGIVMGLKVVRLDGHPIDFRIALVRGLACYLSALILFLGFLWCAWDREKQTWHDKIAGTVVVRLPRGLSII